MLPRRQHPVTAGVEVKPLPLEDKDRKALPIFKWLTEYFPDAIVECVKLSVAGNIQHNKELEPADIKWAREKSSNQMDTAFRHMWDHKAGVTIDKDGCYHLAKAAWRILAELQLTIEKDATANGAQSVRAYEEARANGTILPPDEPTWKGAVRETTTLTCLYCGEEMRLDHVCGGS